MRLDERIKNLYKGQYVDRVSFVAIFYHPRIDLLHLEIND